MFVCLCSYHLFKMYNLGIISAGRPSIGYVWAIALKAPKGSLSKMLGKLDALPWNGGCQSFHGPKNTHHQKKQENLQSCWISIK